MLYAVSNWIYGNEPLRVQFARLARYGYHGIELVGEPDRYNIHEVKSLCTEYGIRVSSILGWSIWGIPGRDSASPDPVERAAALAYGKACVELAHAVGASILVVLPAPAGRTSPSHSPKTEKDWEAAVQTELNLAIDSLGQLAEYAGKQGVVLGLEPINRYETFLVYNVDQALHFIEQVHSDHLKIHLDTFHMNIEENSLVEAVHKVGKLLVNMHISDSNRQAPGRGHIDFVSLVKALHSIDYPGYLTVEPVPPGSDAVLMAGMPKHQPLRDLYAKESLEFLEGADKQSIASLAQR